MKQSVKVSSSKLVDYNVRDLFKTSFEFDEREVFLKKEEPLKNEITDFLNAVKRRKNPLVTGDDGLTALKIAEAAIKSYKKGKVIKI
jgi:UDP-N-acetylglucosamine 3-dehydrogenase